MVIRVLTLAACFLVAGSAQATEVRLRSTASCSATIVRLGDIAEIVSDDPAVAGELTAVPLFPAPTAGKSRRLDRNQVRQLLSISGIDVKQLSLTGSETVEVQSGAGGLASRPAARVGEPSAIRLTSLETAVPAKRPKPAAAEPVVLPPLVKRGESVTVHSRAAGVRITAAGRALSDGALGAEINIEMADKRTKLLARVAGPQTVEVNANK
jgi:flagella basal body P-ring formation protein FlgA